MSSPTCKATPSTDPTIPDNESRGLSHRRETAPSVMGEMPAD